ncbi:MAG: hypothetical protein U1E46_06985 [Hyphomicrobiales bacterium]
MYASTGFFAQKLIAGIIGILAVVAPADAADISRSQDAYSVLLQGELVPGDASRLIAYADSRTRLVVLDSPGGSLGEGLRLAQLIAGAGWNTIVPSGASCISACAISFMGGNERIVGLRAIVGVHAPYKQEDAELGGVTDPQLAVERSLSNLALRKVILEFAKSRGISRQIVDWMFVERQPMFFKAISIEDGTRTNYFTKVVE